MAYSRRNSKIGYCQGFNFIVAKLLMLFDKEQDVFWLFVQIIENILPCDYYSELVGIMGDCSLCLKILKETNKKIIDDDFASNMDEINEKLKQIIDEN